MLFAADVLERNPGAVIIYDVKCTGRLPAGTSCATAAAR
jgi:phosphomannomutase/phosphoglucomutase